MNDVLLLANHKTSLRTMVPLGKYFKEHSDVNPVLLLFQSKRNLGFAVENIGYDFVFASKVHESKAGSTPKFIGYSKKLFKAILNRFRIPIELFLWPWTKPLYVKQLSKDLDTAKGIFSKYEPRALILPDDRSLQTLSYIKTARELGVPTIVVPVSFSNQTGVSIRRVDKIAYKVHGFAAPFVNRIVAKKFPLQTHEFRGKKILFYNGVLVLALQACGMLPSNPWVLGGGDTDFLLVDGFDAKEQAVSLGVPDKKIFVSGHISHDDLFARYSNRSSLYKNLAESYNFKEHKKLIICAVPHLAEHGMITWSKHWEDVEVLVESLVKTGQNILLSLHPKSDLNKYVYLEQKFNCRIAQEKLDEIIALSWLFVAGYSSTIRWAVLSGIPAIAVDFNSLGYDLFDNWDGVVKANRPEQFKASLERMLHDKEYYRDLSTQQTQVSEILTIFDGNARQRIIKFVEKVSIN